MSDDGDSKLEGVDAGSGSDDGGLEIDERQVREMRSIFGASLPQYIEPLEQAAHAILGRSGDPDVIRTFSASVGSLRQAAEKLGFADVSAMLSDLEQAITRVASEPGDVAVKDRETVLGLLIDLRQLGEELGGPHEEIRGRPLAERLTGMPDAGPITAQLARAGLVLDDQLLAARADEIVAVSGLAPATVARVLAYLRGEPALEAVPPAAARAPVARAAPALVEARRDDAPPTADEKLARELATLEAATTRLESRLEEVRIELARGRERQDALRRQQSTLDGEARDLRPAEAELEQWFAVAAELRDRLSAERDLRAQALEEVRRELVRRRDEVAALRRAMEGEEANVASARAALGELEGMINEIQARASRSSP